MSKPVFSAAKKVRYYSKGKKRQGKGKIGKRFSTRITDAKADSTARRVLESPYERFESENATIARLIFREISTLPIMCNGIMVP